MEIITTNFVKLIAVIILFFICGECFSQTHKYYFDATNGNDANTTLQAQNPSTPWKTLSKLSSFSPNFVAGDSILLARGQTFFGTIILSSGKSGTSVSSINFGAYGVGAKPIITGFFSIPSWTSIGSNKWTANVPLAQTTLNMLTIGGTMQPIGRFPKANASTPSWSNGGYYQYQSFSGTTSITSSQISAAPNFVGGQVIIRGNHFDIDRGTISAQNSTTVTYTMESAPIGVSALVANFGFFFQNHTNCLTANGDWCYTSGTQTVTMFNTATPTNVAVSVNQNNVSLSSNNFLSFSNIVFTGSNSVAVNISSCNHITFSNCDFSLHGLNGIQATNNANTHDITVSNCTFSNILNNGIEANNSTIWNINNSTFNNSALIAGMGLTGDGQYQAISYIGNSSSIINNTLTNSGFNAIMFRGTDNVTVQNNFISNFCSIKDDGGGIYCFKSTGTGAKLITGNIVINGTGAPDGTNGIGGGGAIGIYFDGESNNVTCSNNSVASCQQIGILFNDPATATNTGNTVYNCGQSGTGSQFQINASTLQPVRSIINTNNIYVARDLYVAGSQGQECGWFTTPSADIPSFFTRTDSNVYARPVNQATTIFKHDATLTHMTIATWQTFLGNGNELHSKGTPKTIPDTTTNNIIFKYNSSQVATAFPLTGAWEDMNGVQYAGTITLQPFRSAVLIFVSNVQPLSGTATPLISPLSCFGQTTSITVNASGGVPPYQYKIGSGSFGSSNVFTGLGASSYVFQVKDASGTTVTVNGTITQPSQIIISESHTPILINGNSSILTVSASGGTGTLLYSTNGTTFQTSNVFTLTAGTYTITVKDANGCTNTLVTTITQPSALLLSLAATTNPLLCFNNTTILTATASGGTTPYTFKLNNGSPQSGNTFSVGAGSWQVTVTDAAGAITTQTLTITQPTQINISVAFTPITVNGNTSTITVTASGGTSTLTYSLDNITYQSSNVFTNKLAGNYTAYVKDANGCVNFVNFTITQPSNLLVSSSITTAIACNGGTGTITGSASGGTPPYQYQINSGSLQSSPVFSGLIVGSYTLTVHDAGGAIVSASPLTLTQPAPIAISLSYGSAPTTLTITVNSGGVAPFTYQLDNGTPQSGNTFSNVAAGNHTAIVLDHNGCSTVQLFTVGSSLGLTLSVGTILCNGSNTSATVTGNGGTLPYSYLWSDGWVQSTNPNTIAGTYTVTITDGAAHKHDTTFVVSQPTAITFTIATGTISVNGGNTTVTVNSVSGGAGSYTYSLDGGSFGGSNSFSGVLAGNHDVRVKDANGCIKQQFFTITQPGVLIISISRGAAITCAGGTQGITVGGTGGTLPYTFAVDNGTFTATILYNSIAGTHTYSAKDAFGNRVDTIITITQPAQLTLGITFTTILVNGGTSTVTATGGGGTPSLQYSLDGGSYQSSGTFTLVSAGQHNVTVKDANSCTLVNNFSIPQPTSLTMTATPTTNPLACNGDVTTVTLAGSGGTTPYQYGKNGVFGGSTTFTNLSAGTYTFSVKDAFGAQHDTIITLSQPPLITLTQIFSSTITVYGGNADSVIITNAGGTPFNDSTYQYNLDGAGFVSSDSSFKKVYYSVAGGNHSVIIKDANGCTQTFNFVISQPAAPNQYFIRNKRQKHIYIQSP